MIESHEIIELINLEMRAREEADASDSISARIGHLARADAYSEQIKGLRANSKR